MLLSTSVFENFIKWCQKNGFEYRENKNNVKVKVFDVSFTLKRTENGIEIDENSTLWINYKSNYFLPGIPLKKNKLEKLAPNFDYNKYRFGRLFYNSHSNTWGIYGTYMKDNEIFFRKVSNVRPYKLIGIFGEDWEEKYWEVIYR